MNAESENEQSQIFQERLGQWVSSQGFWFQLRHSMSGGVTSGRFVFHLFKLVSRVFIFGVLLLLAAWAFLSFKTGAEDFRVELESSLQKNLHAEEMDLKLSEVSNGELYIGFASALGAESAPYSEFEIRGLRCDRVVLDQFRREWDPGLIEISRLDINLKAGADTEEIAASFGEVYLQDSENVIVDSIEITEANIGWGYSDRTKGSISKSLLKAQRIHGGWRLRLRGGFFTQNWLKDLEIVQMDAEFTKSGLIIQSAEFQKGDGRVSFEGISLTAGKTPEVSGKVVLNEVALESIIPRRAANYLEGIISTDLAVSGSVNSKDGVGFAGKVRLEEKNLIALHDEIPLLRALSVADAYNNYRRLEFRKGSFSLKTRGGGMEINGINLKASDILTLEGDLSSRPPSSEELKSIREASLLGGQEVVGGGAAESASTLAEMLANAESDDDRFGVLESTTETEFKRLGLSMGDDENYGPAEDVVFLTNQYEGNLRLTLRPNAFERAPNLAAEYPVDVQSGRVPMEINLKGPIHDITSETAEKIYRLGTR